MPRHRRWPWLIGLTLFTCQVWINGTPAETRTGADATWCGYDPERNPVPGPTGSALRRAQFSCPGGNCER